MTLRKFHAVAAVVALTTFVISGQYMHWGLGHLAQTPDVPRLMYRTSHIELLFVGLMHVLCALYLRAHEERRARAVQSLGSGLLFVSPIMLALSFWFESPGPSIERLLLRAGINTAFAGVLLHTAAAWVAARSRTKTTAASAVS